MQRSDEEIQNLLMGLMDNELTAEEANEISDILRRNQRWRDEFDSLLQAHQQLKGLRFEEPTDEVLKKLWKSPYSRVAHDAALWMILGGVLFLLGLGLYALFSSGEGGWQIKIPIGAIVVGFAILLLLNIRQRIATYKVDPYKEVER